MYFELYCEDHKGEKSNKPSSPEQQCHLSKESCNTLLINRLGRWCDENGFKFSPTKTMCVLSTTKTSFRSPTLPK